MGDEAGRRSLLDWSFTSNIGVGDEKSLLVNSENICSKPQRARIAMVAQNGKRLIERPLIANDCPRHAKHRRRPATSVRARPAA